MSTPELPTTTEGSAAISATTKALAEFLYRTDDTLPGPFSEMNTQFLLSSAYLVFFMHCGFAMVSECVSSELTSVSAELHFVLLSTTGPGRC